MASTFSFGFSGDDIEENNENIENPTPAPTVSTLDAEKMAKPIPPRAHLIEDFLSTLPYRLSFSTIEISTSLGSKLVLPRRELFDARMQLMTEDTLDENDDNGEILASTLDASDIRTNVYEGGLKTWECSIDLATLMLERGPRKDIDDLFRIGHVVEIGCGTALPSLVLFQHALRHDLPLHFTLTDYNASVLRLITLPNLLLTYLSTLPATAPPFSAATPNPLSDLTWSTASDVYITPEIVTSFRTTLTNQPLVLTLISGSWDLAAPFLSLIPTAPELNTLVLASETIYSPAALSSFAEVLVGVLRHVRLAKGVVAAKKVYFGVGGGVDAFKIKCAGMGAVVSDVQGHGMELGRDGVRRCLVEVQMA